MKHPKFFINSALLFSISALPLYPNSEIHSLIHQDTSRQFQRAQTPEQFLTTHHFLSYDEILNLIDSLENGELEKRYSQADLDKLNHFIAHLARQGILTNEVYSLENDIQELLHTENRSSEHLFSWDFETDEIAIPALFFGNGEVILCKSWIHKKWDQTKKFVKKHKKEILIGAAIVVAAALVVYVVAVASTTTLTNAVVAGAAGAAAVPSEKAERGSTPPESPTASFTSNETPILTTVLEEHVSTFKEAVAENIPLQIASSINEDFSLTETIRTFGSILAHQALDGISEIASCIPQLFEEVKDIGHQIIPETTFSSENKLTIAPLENYEKLITKGHEKIDEAFSTEQAQLYSPEIKERKNNFAFGIIPLPSMLPEIFSNIGKLLEAGKAADRAGFCKAGRHSMKHGYRVGSVFPKPTGNVEQINEQGLITLEKILNHPEKQIVCDTLSRYGQVVEFRTPVGGVRYSIDGTFIGFLEP